MHYAYSAAYAKISVRPSVRLSVCNLGDLWSYRLEYFERNYTDSLISSGLRCSEPKRRRSSPRGTSPRFGWNRVGVAVFRRKPAISLKRGKIGSRLLVITNRKSHTRFQLIPKSTTVDDLEWPLHTPLHNTCVFGAHHINLNDDRPVLSVMMNPYCQRHKYSPEAL